MAGFPTLHPNAAFTRRTVAYGQHGCYTIQRRTTPDYIGHLFRGRSVMATFPETHSIASIALTFSFISRTAAYFSVIWEEECPANT